MLVYILQRNYSKKRCIFFKDIIQDPILSDTSIIIVWKVSLLWWKIYLPAQNLVVSLFMFSCDILQTISGNFSLLKPLFPQLNQFLKLSDSWIFHFMYHKSLFWNCLTHTKPVSSSETCWIFCKFQCNYSSNLVLILCSNLYFSQKENSMPVNTYCSDKIKIHI